MIPDFLEWLGSKWGDQREYLTCETHGGEFGRRDEKQTCPEGCELVVHVPNGEALMLRYLVWKHDQEWLPQHYMQSVSIETDEWTSYWRWLGRKWFARPASLLGGPLDELEGVTNGEA